jgi:molecular chaperone GrpE
VERDKDIEIQAQTMGGESEGSGDQESVAADEKPLPVGPETLDEASEVEKALEEEEGEGEGGAVEPEMVAQLREELAEARAKAEENLDGWQRALADFANYKKRIEREQRITYKMAAGKILLRYLEISDDLERALKNRPQEGEGARWAEGIELIHHKLKSYLEAEGVETIDAEGQAFDPNLHEAISQEESEDHESGQIIEVIKKGYKIEDRVLRPAVVRVAQ